MLHPLETYQKAPYEPLVPVASNPEQMVFKFNSPQHYISWVQGLETFPRGSTDSSSDKEDYSFSLSKSLADAYEVMGATKFDSKDARNLEAKISELKRGTMHADDGFELDVPEFLAGSERVWLTPKHKQIRTRLINDIMFIDGAYNSGRNAAKCLQTAIDLLSAVYRRRVIPRKMVVVFNAENVRTGGNSDGMTFVDVSFMDINGVAKMLHPSAFRRLWFRIAEQYKDLSWGYGSSPEKQTIKGYTAIAHLYSLQGDGFEAEVDKFLGITK